MNDETAIGAAGPGDMEMTDLASLYREQFDAHVGKEFGVLLGDGARFTLVLGEIKETVNKASPRPGGGFSLSFVGPESPMFEHGNIILTDPEGRNMVVYAVNHGPAAGSLHYSVIIS